MKLRGVNLEWYAFIEDFNSHKIVRINVLGESFKQEIASLIKKGKIANRIELKVAIKNILQFEYWSKCEYEILVTGLFGDNTHKIDVYYQLEPNLDRIVEYAEKEMELNF